MNSGLMTFFFVVGLEARRELDLGELRERRRFCCRCSRRSPEWAPAVAIYSAFNAGNSSAAGWGLVMSTDTALALGLLALVGPRLDRLRAFMLTVVIVDDIVALAVIATVYSEALNLVPLLVAVACFAGVVAARRLRIRRGPVCFALGPRRPVALLDRAASSSSDSRSDSLPTPTRPRAKP